MQPAHTEAPHACWRPTGLSMAASVCGSPGRGLTLERRQRLQVPQLAQVPQLHSL